MRSKHVKAVAIVAGASILALALGVAVGNIYAAAKRRSQEQARLDEKQQFLSSKMRDLKIGQPFPGFLIRNPEKNFTVRIEDILPDGGTLIYVAADCPSCFDAILRLDTALALEASTAKKVAVMAGGDARELLAFARSNGVGCSIYEDPERALMARYHVLVFPTYFNLDRGGVIRAIGADVESVESYRQLVVR